MRNAYGDVTYISDNKHSIMGDVYSLITHSLDVLKDGRYVVPNKITNSFTNDYYYDSDYSAFTTLEKAVAYSTKSNIDEVLYMVENSVLDMIFGHSTEVKTQASNCILDVSMKRLPMMYRSDDTIVDCISTVSHIAFNVFNEPFDVNAPIIATNDVKKFKYFLELIKLSGVLDKVCSHKGYNAFCKGSLIKLKRNNLDYICKEMNFDIIKISEEYDNEKETTREKSST